MANTTIALQRLANQQVAHQQFTRPEEVVAWLGAMQAQDYLGSLWAIGARTPGSTEATIEQAIAEKKIVRTWPMRGTIHFVAAADVRWMLELLAPRVVQRTAARRRDFEVDETVMAASARAVTAALKGGKHLPRNTLYEVLEQANIATGASRGLHILGWLAHDGLLCFGARAGKQPTFALLDEWAPNAKSLPRDEAIAQLTLRYFSGHGPATIQDFMWWSGLTNTEVKTGLAAVGAQLANDTIDGQEYYFAPDLPPAKKASSVFLLPPFDEFLVAYRDRSAALDPEYNTLIVPGGNGIFNPIIVIDGQVVGTWKRTIKKETVVLAFNPFASFSDAEITAITAAAEPYGAFVGKQVVVANEP